MQCGPCKVDPGRFEIMSHRNAPCVVTHLHTLANECVSSCLTHNQADFDNGSLHSLFYARFGVLILIY